MSKLKQTKRDALVLHFASKTPLHFGRKKLAKLLYFVDFTAYELREKSVSGEKYLKFKYGPIPKNFYLMLEDMEKKGFIKNDDQKAEYLSASIEPKTKPDYSVFSDDEREIIDVITDRFKNITASELETIAKGEAPYKMVEFNEEIPYHLAFYRNSFDEMELSDNGNSR